MISNLQKAARDRETVMIGGGEFGRDDFLLASHMMVSFYELRHESQRLIERLSSMAVHPSHYQGLESAVRKAHQNPTRGAV